MQKSNRKTSNFPSDIMPAKHMSFYTLLKPRPIISLLVVIIIKACGSISLILFLSFMASNLLQTV